MKKISNEVKIGIAFLVAIVILYYGISFLKGINKLKPSNSYMATFENVEGLTQSTPVTINGFQVGLVYKMALAENNPEQAIVYLNMDKAIKIKKGSKLELEVSMLGNATIALEPNPYTEELYTDSDTIPGVRKKGMMDAATNMVPQVEQMLPKIDSILTGIQVLVNNPALQQSLTNVNEITKNLTLATRQLNSTLGKDLPAITGNVNNITKDLAGATSQLKEIDAKAMFESLDKTLKNFEDLSKKLNSTDGSLGLLMNDRQLYDSLNTTIGNASALLKDVKENPSKYINVKVF